MAIQPEKKLLNIDPPVESLDLSGSALMHLWGSGITTLSHLLGQNLVDLEERFKSVSLSNEEEFGPVISEIEEQLEERGLELNVLTDAERHKRSKSKKLRNRRKKTKKISRRFHDEEPEALPDFGYGYTDRGLDTTFNPDSEGVVASIMRYARRFKLLPHERHIQLFELYRRSGNLAIRDDLVNHNIRLAISVAKTYRPSGLPFEDLIQEGAIGLLVAIERYNYELGFTFSTYAIQWVRQAVQRFVQNESSTVRIPVHMREGLSKMRRAMQEITEEQNGSPPTVAQIALRIDKSQEDVVKMLRADRMTTVLYFDMELETKNSETRTLGDTIPDDRFLLPERAVEASEELHGIIGRLNELTDLLNRCELIEDRDKELFTSFFGLNGNLLVKTLEHVGDNFGVTRERVRQIIARSWKMLRFSGLDMDHESLLTDIRHLKELEKLTHRRVSGG